MQTLRELIASIVAFISNRENAEAADDMRYEYAYVPVRVETPAEYLEQINRANGWRDY
ncbi:MAG: hypothetical protein ACYC1C_13700 [Chloroflexota bacterium]|nr:hypothetical protein [Dehalococcoidales bacterium]